MNRLNDLLLWIEVRPWALRLVMLLMLVVSPVLYPILAVVSQWDRITDAYRTLFRALLSGEMD